MNTEEILSQKIYLLILMFFIGGLYAQDAPPSDTENQENIEASEDPNAAPENQAVAPKDQNTVSEEAMPVEDTEKPEEEKKYYLTLMLRQLMYP